MPMDVLFGKPPKMTRNVSRRAVHVPPFKHNHHQKKKAIQRQQPQLILEGIAEVCAVGCSATVGDDPKPLETEGVIDPQAAATLVETLFDSDIYRADQRSFMLYPDRPLPG